MVQRCLLLLLLVTAGCGGADDSAPAPSDGSSGVAGAPSDTLFPGAPPAEAAAGFDSVPLQPNASPGQPPETGAPSGSAAPPADPVLAGAGVPAVGTDASEILARAERAYSQMRSMQADFTQNLHVPLLDVTRRSRGVMYHQTPDRFAMRFTDPEGDLIVADGRYIWSYNPSSDPGQVTRTGRAEGGLDLQREFLSDATSRYIATRTGAEPVGGRTAHVLSLVPRGPSQYRRIRIWVDAEDYLVRRFEIEETNESVRLLELSNLRPNASIPASIFQFTPPPGARIAEF